MIFSELGACHRTRIPPRSYYRPRSFEPKIKRDLSTVHQPGLGGVLYHVDLGAQCMGEVVNAWSARDGVHWQAIWGSSTVVENDCHRPVAYATIVDAVNALLGVNGWAPDWAPESQKLRRHLPVLD